jgi:hypothetical protein
MSYQFKTADIIKESERLMGLSEEAGLLGCQMAQALSNQHNHEPQTSEFYSAVSAYCYAMECCSSEIAQRYKRAISSGENYNWPHPDFLPLDEAHI